MPAGSVEASRSGPGSSSADTLAIKLPAVTPGHAEDLARQGFVTFSKLWSATIAEGIAQEAAALFPTAELTVRRTGAPVQATASDAPLLAQLQFALVPLARALTGQLLVPAYGWYNFYPTDDAIWLHVDVEKSDLAILATALGAVGPLHLHPELAGMTQTELDQRQGDPSWNEYSGDQIGYPERGVLALRGRKLPHHRPGHPLPAPGAVAAMHYISLL